MQIEEEFTEGLLGSVPGHNTWEVQALVAIELQVSPGKSGKRWEVGVIWRWGRFGGGGNLEVGEIWRWGDSFSHQHIYGSYVLILCYKFA